MDYGKRFKYYRTNAKLTQKEAAELIGINDYQLANYETNRSQPNIDILKKMSKAYKVSIDNMVGNSTLRNKYVSEEDTYIDPDELLANLNEIVEKMNKANKK